MATLEDGAGKPAVLHVLSKVLEVDPETATIKLDNGEVVTADLVLGADGIYSKTRTFVSGHPSKLFTSGKAAFRFLIPRKSALADPAVAKICENDAELAIWYGDDRRVVMYPCDNNELLNFVCIHPEGESQGGADGEQCHNSLLNSIS
jgi:2-polyprenyl-6-methoxyphenol hydroxylase-like FAD-dependent oxidoreductase